MTTDDKPQENTLPEPPTDEKVRQEMRERAEACGQELQAVLRKHRCWLQPFLQPMEAVGNDGSRAMIQASYAVMPHE